MRAEIARQLDVLPETYDHGETRLRRGFRSALLAFLRELLLADPQDLHVASTLLTEHRAELEYVKETLEWRLRLARQAPSAWNQDNAFLWRYTSNRRDVPLDADEEVSDFYEKRKFDLLEPRCRLLVEAFPTYADGFNTLGLIALHRDDLPAAIAHFEKTVEVGRTLFPKRIAKDRWWSDTDTRPYLRGLGNLAIALNRAGRYEEALAACHQLDVCSQEGEAEARRAAISLNRGRHQEAAVNAVRLSGLWAGEVSVAAFALWELGRDAEALREFVHAALNHPRTARRLAGEKVGAPSCRQDWEDDELEHDMRRDLHAWFGRRSRVLRRVRDRVRAPALRALLLEVEDLRVRERQAPPGDRVIFDRLVEMRSVEFANRMVPKTLDG